MDTSSIVYDCYVRKSTEEKERQILSIDSQLEQIDATYHDLPIDVRHVEAKSAFTPGNRPKFDEMIQRIESGVVQGIVAWHPNRLARNEIEAAKITYLLRTGVLLDLKFVSTPFDNTPEGIWMLQMTMSQGQYESAKLGRDVLRGMRTKVKRGDFPGSAPVGYLNSGPTTLKGTRYVYADPERFQVVRRAVDLALTGRYTIAELYRIMATDWGLTPAKHRRRSSGPISYGQVAKLFHNIFYTGYFNWEGELQQGSYEPLMTMEEYERLQAIFRRNRNGVLSRYVKRPYIRFNGFIRCGECGAAVVGSESKKHYPRTGRSVTYLYYRCGRTSRRRVCRQPAIPEAELVRQLETMLRAYRILPEFRDLAQDYLRQQEGAQAQRERSTRELQQRELAQLQAKLDRLIDLRADGEVDREDFARRQRDLKTQIAKLESAVEMERKREEELRRTTADNLNFAATALGRFRTSEGEDQRRIVMSVGSKFRLTNRELTYTPNRWLQVLNSIYSPVEAAYLLLRAEKTDITTTPTRIFGFLNERKDAFASLLSQWCLGVDAIAEVINEDRESIDDNPSTHQLDTD